MIVTQEHLFQWNMEQVLFRIRTDWYSSWEKSGLSFEDWLHDNPKIVGEYCLEQLSDNFDFENFNN